jgi:hypothetical protein
MIISDFLCNVVQLSCLTSQARSEALVFFLAIALVANQVAILRINNKNPNPLQVKVRDSDSFPQPFYSLIQINENGFLNSYPFKNKYKNTKFCR